ncbi:hypothetical protein TSTA_034660 [Talaromyces stipitatus ATCC 10500]|uniref:Uncharacterized protein n=1 Tax=Talaromyces stipitatus (strain ATCC 10500 / CBS 375.48 / QM 6759 / NRRL 1006) TaxID=441959 RepID=B8M709_TALSN|nr:uncharacterized protein TSTA_034660 [Talaromyces stipitatus ATCC 10500]EED20229.1 hypothetical protein TSTA_034660 [Talaromyces stipitatus ATCC 10500]
METINAYAVSPWTDRLHMRGDYDREKAMRIANSAEGILIATSSSAKGDMVGMGGRLKLILPWIFNSNQSALAAIG